VFLFGIGVALGFEGTQGGDELCARLRWLDHGIDVAAFGGDVGICKALAEFGDFLLAQALPVGFRRAVEEALAAGGALLCGGKARPGPGFFVEPTIIRNARNEWPVVQRETFAPILYIIPYRDLAQALQLHNGVPQGLSSAIFTRSLRDAETFLSAAGSDCGIANVNLGTSGAEIGGAFGGEKETGGGREAGSDAWQAYMRRQTSTINWSRELPLAQGIKFGSGPG